MTISHSERYTPREPRPLQLDISNVDLYVTPEQFDRLCANNPDRQLELTPDGKVLVTSEVVADSEISPEKDVDRQQLQSPQQSPDIVQTFDRLGKPFTYNVLDLYWNPQSYDYLQDQEEKFRQCLPNLMQQYAGQYVVFENGQVIDFDDDEDILLSRIASNESYKNRPAIFCVFVPVAIVDPKLNAIYQNGNSKFGSIV
jgi:hypothetical protein